MKLYDWIKSHILGTRPKTPISKDGHAIIQGQTVYFVYPNYCILEFTVLNALPNKHASILVRDGVTGDCRTAAASQFYSDKDRAIQELK